MREQKLRANWLNTENARCYRTVCITMQNVTSKLQIGLSPEMGWYPVSFIIIVNKGVWMCTPGRCSWDLFKNWDRFVLAWCLKSFLFWRLFMRYRSCFFHSCIFHSRIFSARVCASRTQCLICICVCEFPTETSTSRVDPRVESDRVDFCEFRRVSRVRSKIVALVLVIQYLVHVSSPLQCPFSQC